MQKLLFTLIFIISSSITMWASVVYTDITDVTVQGVTTAAIDLDNDGQAEFTLEDMGFGSPAEVGTMTNPAEVDFVTWSAAADWDAFKPLAVNTIINSSSGFYTQGDCYFNPFWAGTTHQFPIGTDQYIGVKFKKGSAMHYAWVRVHLAANGTITVKDYAYESSAGNAIDAGAMGGGTQISNIEETPVTVYPNPVQSNLFIDGLSGENKTIEVYNQTGVLLMRKTIYANGNTSVDVDNLISGYYIVKIWSNTSASVRIPFIKL